MAIMTLAGGQERQKERKGVLGGVVIRLPRISLNGWNKAPQQTDGLVVSRPTEVNLSVRDNPEQDRRQDDSFLMSLSNWK